MGRPVGVEDGGGVAAREGERVGELVRERAAGSGGDAGERGRQRENRKGSSARGVPVDTDVFLAAS